VKDSVTNENKDTLYLKADYKNPYPEKISSDDKKVFKKLLGDSLSAEMFALHAAYDSIATERQMMIYFRGLTVFQERSFSHLMDMNASEDLFNEIMADKAKNNIPVEEYDEYSLAIDFILENLKPANDYLKGMILACVAECTEPHFDLQLTAFKKKVKETEGTDDDDFISFMTTYFDSEFEPEVMSATWFEPTWDLGGMSLLGSGKHTSFLMETDRMLEEKNIFSKWILYYRELCIEDASSWKSFAHSKEKVLSELKSILKKVKLTEKESDDIRSQIRDIESGTEEDFQFDCKTNDCAFG
jgi:hypothetical protein